MNWTAANCVKESDQDLDSSFFTLLAPVLERGTMDVISEFANPFPAAATMGVPAEDYAQLKLWSADFAEILKTVEDMTAYFHERVAEERKPGEGLIHSLLRAEVDGDRLSEEEVVANCIITMTGGRETTTNLIASGLLTLLRHPAEFGRLGTDSSLMLSAIEELLRFETLSQHTGRIAPQDVELGRKQIRAGDAVLAVMAAANRDPQRFPEPDRLDLARTDNCHTAFGWGQPLLFRCSAGAARSSNCIRPADSPAELALSRKRAYAADEVGAAWTHCAAGCVRSSHGERWHGSAHTPFTNFRRG